jgi:DNA-binding GntR family transcriptional regulator
MAVRQPRKMGTRKDRPQLVYEQLRQLIVHGRLAPGSRLVETDIATRFKVSRTPVRGALQRLQQEGYIIDSPSMRQSRPTVAPLTREDAAELFGIVGHLEALAARRAAQLPKQRREALAAEMTAINEEFRKVSLASRPDHRKLFELDEQVHGAYVEAAAGPRLLALHHAVKPQAERYERLYVSFLTGELMTSVQEHEAIIDAIAAGRPAGAAQAVRTNWENAAVRLGEVIEHAGERGQW